MSQGINQNELQEKTQKLLQGPLKHVRAAALAAALLPLASVAATPAAAQTACPPAASGGIPVCGIVFNDTNANGYQDAGEPGMEGVKVFISNGVDIIGETETGPGGSYFFEVQSAPLTVAALIPTEWKASPSGADSDGVSDGYGYSVAPIGTLGFSTDFGFFTPAVQQPGTGTPGYWKNHPDAWPVANITVGGVTYTKAAAIAWLGKVGKDKTTTMFSSLVSAMLNVLLVGNDASCVNSTIALANTWMAAHHVGTNVAASSDAWTIGEPLHMQMDAYNNGLLCAPHRN
jgi:hypothetical protein